MTEHAEVGSIKATTPIMVRREVEAGQTWEAESPAHNQAALGKTPKEAVTNLLAALSGKGLSFQAHADEKKLAALVAVSGGSTERETDD